MKKKSVLSVAFTLVILLVTSCADAELLKPGGTETLRYKMTVTIETPEGDKIGSAVREAGLYNEKSILPDQGGSIYNITKGEAVVVDLGQRGIMFALLGGQDEARNVFKGFPHREKNLIIQLASEQYPKFVRFRDLSDPKTVESLLETSLCLEKDESGTCVKEGFHVVANRFEETFGEGVRLKSVVIERTDEEMVKQIKQKLKWLPEFYSKRLDGQRFGSSKAIYKVANSLSAGAFLVGEKK